LVGEAILEVVDAHRRERGLGEIENFVPGRRRLVTASLRFRSRYWPLSMVAGPF
jgi:hypothetical protein